MEDRQSKMMACFSQRRVNPNFLLSWLALSSIFSTTTSASWADGWWNGPNQMPLVPPAPLSTYEPQPASNPSNQETEFTLRHIFHHGTYEYPNAHVRMDITPTNDVWTIEDDEEEREEGEGFGSFRVESQTTTIQRLSNRKVETVQSMYHAARMRGSAPLLDPSAWTMDEVPGPNIRDKKSVLSLAKMTWNAYTKVPRTGDWQEVHGRFNHSQGFGWEGDGLRGHIFANKDNSTIIVSLKGTSPAVFDGAETTTNDKINDNLFFGCCCGQGGQYLWHAVCDCMTSAYTCNQTCVVKALKEENRYYKASIELYGNVTELYPNSNFWLIGHSLGGSTSALLGLTFGIPVVTFEAPGEALAAARLGLPSPPGAHPSAPQTRKYTGAAHFGHTADPIFMGSCNAATSACTLGGYSMQTECHTGTVCRYDTVADLGWRVGAGYHKIRSVVQDVIPAYNDTPPCVPDEECIDCFNWKYFESNGSDTTTTTSSTSSTASPTRTATCKTPGWWGCLDETTSLPPTTTPTTTTTTTSTLVPPSTSCLSYGWFGNCILTTTLSNTTLTKHPTKPTTTTPTTTPAAILTTSCLQRGWLGGCKSSTVLTPERGTTAANAAPVPTVTTTRPVVRTGGVAETAAAVGGGG